MHTKQLRSFLLSSTILIILDAIFITINAGMFSRMLIKIQKEPVKIRYGSALLCYLILATGFWFFVIFRNRPVWEAFLLGIFVYGVYETTNYSAIRHWSPTTVAIDTLWGGILFGATAYLTRYFQV